MKFLHTADWQIGMKAQSVGEAGARVREERIAAGKRVVDAARKHGAEFVVVTGDVFEDNAVDRVLVQKVADILGRFNGPVFIIPGNHDPLTPGSVWEHPVWKSSANVRVLREAVPVQLSGTVLFPCPALEKHSGADPTAWIPPERQGGIRIGLAHGTVEGIRQDEPDYPIPRDAAQRSGLDYLALGHWHSYAMYPGPNDAPAMAYSGTHETTKFGERDSGNALIVEFVSPGAPPTITPVRTGGLIWSSIEKEVRERGDLVRVREDIEAMGDPAISVTKQFLVHQSALLERKEDGRYRPLAEGTSADTKARDLLTQNPPGKGFAQFRNWGFAQVLWAPQGSLSFSSLSEDLVANIRSMLGPQVSGSGTDPIAGKIEERYLAFYTPTGKPRTGKDAPSLTGLERELEEAREAFRAALSDYQAFDDASRRVEDLRARREQSRLDAQEITKALEDTRQRAEAYRTLLAEKDRRSERAKTAEAQHDQLKQQITLIQKTEKAYAEAKNTLAAMEAEVPLKAREVQERAKEVEKTRIALEDARKGRKDVEGAEDSAEEARQFAEGTKARVELDAIIARIQATQQLLGEKMMDRSKLVAPDAKALRAIRKALKARDEAKVRLEASLIILEVTLDQDGQLDIVAGEEAGPQPALKDVPIRVQGSPEIVVVIPECCPFARLGPNRFSRGTSQCVGQGRGKAGKADDAVRIRGPGRAGSPGRKSH
ncbi:MAG: metallophosphoesterase [Candidatus Latescibacteria bacterium]|nr:metallophosphoesterase [Candidatus Latescibacterota bacterium]